MVDKLRAVERETPVIGDTRTTHGEGDKNENIQVQLPRVKERTGAYTSPQVTVTDSTSTPSSTGGMEDISLTSPSVAESLRPDAMQTPEQNREPPVPERTLSSALRRLVAKPSTPKGTVHNPIVLDEYSPRRQPIPLPPRDAPEYEPHKFKNRYRKLYTYPERPVLATIPANGNSFLNNGSRYLSRMVNAKGTTYPRPLAAAGRPQPRPVPAAERPQPRPPVAAEGRPQPVPAAAAQPRPIAAAPAQPRPIAAAPAQPRLVTAAAQPSSFPDGQVIYGIPFAVQFPRSAQYLMDQCNPVPPYSSPYARHHSNMDVMTSGDSENMLRRKAIQHVRDSSRPQLHKKMLSDDPDETSDDDSDQPGRSHVYQDPNDHLSPLLRQAALLDSLLQCYETSADQAGLREDISLLVGVQKKKVGEWIQAENQREKKSDERVRRAVDQLLAREAEKDQGVRGLLCSDADMWQGGAEGVAQIFGADRSRGGEKAGRKRKLGVCGEDMVL